MPYIDNITYCKSNTRHAGKLIFEIFYDWYLNLIKTSLWMYLRSVIRTVRKPGVRLCGMLRGIDRQLSYQSTLC